MDNLSETILSLTLVAFFFPPPLLCKGVLWVLPKKWHVSTLQENVTLISEINELRKELHSLRSQVKEQQAQMATLEMNKSHLAQEFDQEDVN